MKTSNLRSHFPVSGKAVSKFEREANAKMFNASGSGFNDSDPNFMATGGATSTQEPYVVEISNTGEEVQKAVLFGAFKFLNVSNSGSGANVVVSMAIGNVSYAQMLQQSIVQPFEIVLTRVESQSAVQLRTSFSLKTQSADGTAQSRPITVSSYNSPDQLQTTLIDVKQSYRIDGSTWLEYAMQPGTQVRISFFVSAQVDMAKPLNGQAPIQEFTSQRVRTFTN